MAVASSVAVSPAKTTTGKKRKATEPVEEEVNAEMVQDTSDLNQDAGLVSPKQPKRTKSPGVRVVGNRVYDSANGTTCHQCRQKTLDFAAACKNIRNDKQCTLKWCHKCLLNRYGEKAEEVALFDDWKCPRCRDICNCSFCMKKRGCHPTGILAHNAKAKGFSSVSDMLKVQSPKSLSQEEIAKSKDGTIALPKKIGKENKLIGAQNEISDSQLKNPNSKKSKKVKDLTEKKDVSGVKNESTETGVVKSGKRMNGSVQILDAKKDNDDISKMKTDKVKDSTETCQVNKVKRKNLTKMKKVKESTDIGDAEKAKLKELADLCDAEGGNHALSNAEESEVPEGGRTKKAKLHPNGHILLHEKPKKVEIILPDGNELVNVAELDLLPEDVGNALQFIEFCYTFGEVLEIRKGQAESVLRDMMLGRNRRGKVSSLVYFQIQLLTLILKDMGEESPLSPTDGTDCWLHALKELVSESDSAAKDLAALSFEKTDTYDMLSTSEKLRLLVFLCDETLDTLQVRDWMEEENLKFSEKKKEAKEKLHDARQKAKLSKTKLQDEVAKAIIAKNGAPLSISEHDALFSQMKAESELAHAEVLETMGLVPKDKDTPDSVRIEPVITDSKGHSYWRLKGCIKFEFVRQEIQGRDEAKASEKWFSYKDDKDIQLIKEYQSFSRVEKKKRKTKVLKMENGNSNPSSTTINANDSPL